MLNRSRMDPCKSALVRVVVFALFFAACSRPPALSTLSSVDELKARFNADAGKPRIILLMSPT